MRTDQLAVGTIANYRAVVAAVPQYQRVDRTVPQSAQPTNCKARVSYRVGTTARGITTCIQSAKNLMICVGPWEPMKQVAVDHTP